MFKTIVLAAGVLGLLASSAAGDRRGRPHGRDCRHNG
jgi:hypothetical protein